MDFLSTFNKNFVIKKINLIDLKKGIKKIFFFVVSDTVVKSFYLFTFFNYGFFPFHNNILFKTVLFDENSISTSNLLHQRGIEPRTSNFIVRSQTVGLQYN